jgi:prepilin-type N-terminal cleavage/methylation domain-containing protein
MIRHRRIHHQGPRPARRGFTLPEVLIAVTVGMIVLVSAVNFSVSSWTTRRGWTLRETVDRDARFVGLSLARDVQEAGIAFTSTPVFASVDAGGDTLSVLSVPFSPAEAPVYPIYDDGDPAPTYPPGGTCGATCIEFQRVDGRVDLAAGDVVRLQVGSVRRLLLLTSVTPMGTTQFRVTFLPTGRLVNRPAGIDSLLLARTGTSIQKTTFVMYWRDPARRSLMRADRLDASGQPVPSMMASEVEAFEARLLFTAGTEHPSYNGLDADTTNDGNDIIGVKIRTKLRSQRTDPAVSGGQPISRWYEWQVAPRNLLYEKSRL